MLQKGYVSGKVNKIQLFNVSIPQDTPAQGFVGLGTDSYGYADWDYFDISSADNPHLPARHRHTLYYSAGRH